MTASSQMGVVVIGRNEGERLKLCLRSIPDNIAVVYVDSGSTDDSVEFAQSVGFDVIELDMSIPFTAARARNAGWSFIVKKYPHIEFIQFVDGDCEIIEKWFEIAFKSISLEDDVAAVFGRLRERFLDKSVYNRICDSEWDVPVGIVASCGGNVLFRVSALTAVRGFSDDLIAGEEPDLCLRLRQIGWRIRRIDAEMAFHDAAIYSFSSWWRRAIRSGYAYAEHVRRHGRRSDPLWARQLLSISAWGLLLPAIFIVIFVYALPVSNFWAVLLVPLFCSLYVWQVIRIDTRKRAEGAAWPFALSVGSLTVVGKFAELLGVVKCWLNYALRRKQNLIEYKNS